MSKKTPAKKSKRRLKRSVRRSLAAVLMITAIGVAAIPVPENFADEVNPVSDEISSRIADVHTEYSYINATEDEYENYFSDENAINLSRYYDPDHPQDLSRVIEGMEATGQWEKVYPSLNIVDQGGGQWDLGWQFMYYQTRNPKSNEIQGVVCKYNGQYRAEQVNLELTPTTEYYTVNPNKVDAYFNPDGKTVEDENGNITVIMTHAAGKRGMNSDPCDPAEYTYNDYLDGSPTTSEGRLAKEFFEKYYKDAYDAKTREFAAYKAAKDRYDALPPDQQAAATEPVRPTSLSVIPADILTAEQKLIYYCDHDTALSQMGSGYTLASVIDSRLRADDATISGNSEYIYVAKGGTPLSAQHPNDANGFLIVEQGVKMCAIGAGAFYGVGNVDILTIPDQIGYIGDDAFCNSFIKEIAIVSVDQIGNRAFKNCSQLKKATINSGTYVLGAECFEGSGVTSIALPYTVTTIGYGAFANCKALTTLDLNGITNPCQIKEAAFYNCTALAELKMDTAAITCLGKAALAVESGAAPISIVMPASMQSTSRYRDATGQNVNIQNSIGDYLFAGRSSLDHVVFPKDYGRTAAQSKRLPDNMFHGCVNLQYVEFPVDIRSDPYACGYVELDDKSMKSDREEGDTETKKLFADIINPDFYVRGPEFNSSREEAYPRQSTWNEVTQVNNFVPYVFKNSAGVDCYEVKMGDYRYQANEKGELTSCVLVDPSKPTNGELVIPSKVGNYKINSIVDGCFTDEVLRKSIRSIIIQDDSITTIADSVFKDLPHLEKVIVGNSVSAIGNSAFEGCNLLTDVTFHTPLAGHEGFTIGNKAFQTGSDELTFHGDIVKGYAPFDWATDAGNVIRENGGVRVCYKSLSPTYLTVMYNPNTELVTLLDYPKYSQVSQVLNDSHAQEIKDGRYGTYENMMVQRSYAQYNDSYYDGHRRGFAQAWKRIVDMPDRTEEEQTAKENAKNELFASNDYGPWVNNAAPNNFCSNWENWLEADTGETTENTLTDWLFEPIVAHAASNPPAYFDTYPYDVVKNAESGDVYRGLTQEEQDLVNSTKNIVIPVGVDSIDVYGYYNNLNIDGTKGQNDNGENVRTYLVDKNWDADARRMYTRPGTDALDDTDIIPGLFSGQYNDNCDEIHERGNDRIEQVTLNSVKYLPDYAFDSCERLSAVFLGEDCADIGTAPFRGCTSLSFVSNNQWYETVNGIVYSKNKAADGTDDGTYIIEECLSARGRLVGQSEVTLVNDPNISGVSTIRPGAFESCADITIVDLSNASKLTEIPKDCFRNCDGEAGQSKGITRITLPRTVNSIESGAFENDTKLIELTILGKEVFISARAFKDNNKAQTAVRTYQDSSAKRYVDTYGNDYNLYLDPITDEWRVIFLDADGQQVGETQYIQNDSYADAPEDPVKEGWTFEGWLGTNNTKITDKIHEDTIFIAQGYYTNGMVDGKYKVEFYDQIDGAKIGATQLVAPGGEALAPQAPVHQGYTFLKWSSDAYLNVTENLTILAMYSGGNGNGGNGNGTTSRGTTNTPGTSGNTTSNRTTSTSGTSTSTSGSSTSTTSTSTQAAGKYTVVVVNGSGSGSYDAGSTVIIAANTPATGKKFLRWTTETQGVTLASVSLPATTFVMPASNVTVTAEYTDDASTPTNGTVTATPTSTSTGGGTRTTPVADNGNTRVDITKPGISNRDLATANVNGSTDNFIVKISETDEATQAVMNALTNKYGSLENILYYAMDISLYDSTGTTKITDTTGLTVDITIPLPDALVTYGGNNMMGAVVSNQIEDLSERFSTINGVPCISFTATHFSPYTIYVNTQNLSEGLLDTTPKTGDPIHPKWFLSLGLACLSVILFMKKDKKVKVKAKA